MQIGQLIHGEAFSLFEAMSAVELGNAKMDSAAAQAAEPEAQMASAEAAPASLSDDELAAVLDHLVLLEASWFAGNSFMQTVASCRYFASVEE